MIRVAARGGLTLVLFVAAGCGGGGSSGASSGSTVAATPRQAFRCLQNAGLKVKSTPPNEAAVISAMIVDSGTPASISLSFLRSPAAAKRFANHVEALAKPIGGNSGTEVVNAKIVLVRGRTAKGSTLSMIKPCLGA